MYIVRFTDQEHNILVDFILISCPQIPKFAFSNIYKFKFLSSNNIFVN